MWHDHEEMEILKTVRETGATVAQLEKDFREFRKSQRECCQQLNKKLDEVLAGEQTPNPAVSFTAEVTVP